MRQPKTLPPEEIRRINELLGKARTKADYQRIQCVWLQAALHLSIAQVALAVGWPEEKVRKVRSNYFRTGEASLIGVERGGSRHRHLTPEEELELLGLLSQEPIMAGKTFAAKVKEAYEQRVGHSVPRSTIYRMLKRCGRRLDATPAG